MGGAPGHSKLCFLKLLWECTGSSSLGRAPQEGEAGVGLSRKALDQKQLLMESRAPGSSGKSQGCSCYSVFHWGNIVRLASY